MQALTNILTEVDAWILALVLGALMLTALALGWRRGQSLAAHKRDVPDSKYGDASMALLGLLLGFTFSLSLGMHEQRRQMVVSDSNSIGDFYTCASLVKPPVRGRLQAAIREYVGLRLGLADKYRDEAEFQKKLAAIQESQNRMQTLVDEAIEAGTPIAVPLVNTYNEVTSSHAARLAALRYHLLPSIVFILFLSAVVCMLLTGVHHAAKGKRSIGAPLVFVVLVTLVVWVILDLNQPHRGLITVSQEPMQRVLSGMEKQP
jgi:hypothetical protein